MKLPHYDTLTLDLQQQIATVTLNRPDKANAMNAPMWAELELCFDWLDAEPSVRVVVLAGAGKHFCSGLDLNVFTGILAEAGEMEPCRRVEALRRKLLTMQGNLTAIERCRKPVLAAIHYTCIGGAIDMISCCDMRYCSEDAFFSIKEIDLGMTADVGTLQRLPHLIGQGLVRELAYTGRTVAAGEAKAMGLVNQVFADQASMMNGVMDIARQIAAKSPLAIRGIKEMLLYSRDHSVADGLNHIATWNAGMLSADDVMQSVAANAAGKTPIFED